MPTQSIRRVFRSRRPWIVAALAALVAASSLAPGATAGDGPERDRGGKVVPPKSGTWFGTYEEQSGSQRAKMNRVLDTEELLGRKMDVGHTYTAWTDNIIGWRERWDAAHGRVPLVSWAKASTWAINSGRYDGLIRKRAAEVKAADFPILLEWFWEMDGRRNRWAARSPASFIAAWRRIHRIFDRAGVKNVSWVWCPNAWGFHTGEAQRYYPGDAYVDWICANGYNWAPGRRGDQWRPFEWVFEKFYDWAADRGKPIIISEFGVQERRPGEKAEWLRDAAHVLKTKFTKIKAVVYFNVKKHHDWRISTPSARSAFRYLANEIRPRSADGAGRWPDGDDDSRDQPAEPDARDPEDHEEQTVPEAGDRPSTM